MAQKLASKQSQAISLKGSTKIVCEFFDFSVVRPPAASSLRSLAQAATEPFPHPGQQIQRADRPI
jgi:hypothetical protein